MQLLHQENVVGTGSLNHALSKEGNRQKERTILSRPPRFRQ